MVAAVNGESGNGAAKYYRCANRFYSNSAVMAVMNYRYYRCGNRNRRRRTAMTISDTAMVSNRLFYSLINAKLHGNCVISVI